MKYFENNILDDLSTTDTVNDLIEITGAISVNSLMVAGGEAEQNEKDAGAWWSMLALCEAALSRFPEELRTKGYDLVNGNVNRELAEKAMREKARKSAERALSVILNLMKED